MPNPKNSRLAISPLIAQNFQTKSDGKYEFFTGPGDYYITGVRNAKVPEFTVEAGKFQTVNIFAKGPASIPFIGRVVLASDPTKGVAEANVRGVPYKSGLRQV